MQRAGASVGRLDPMQAVIGIATRPSKSSAGQGGRGGWKGVDPGVYEVGYGRNGQGRMGLVVPGPNLPA